MVYSPQPMWTQDPLAAAAGAGGGAGAARSGGAPPAARDDFEALLLKLLSTDDGLLDQLIDLSERRRTERRQRAQGGDFGGLSGTQRAYLESRGDPESFQGALATMSLINRQRLLRGAGLPDAGPWIAPQKAGETDAEYVERMRAAKAADDQRRAEAAAKNRARAAADRARKAASGQPGTFFAVREEDDDPRGDAQRARDARDFAQGRRVPQTDAEMRDAEYNIAAARFGALPARRKNYRAFVGVEGQGPLREAASGADLEYVSDRGRHLLDEELARLLKQQAGLAGPEMSDAEIDAGF